MGCLGGFVQKKPQHQQNTNKSPKHNNSAPPKTIILIPPAVSAFLLSLCLTFLWPQNKSKGQETGTAWAVWLLGLSSPARLAFRAVFCLFSSPLFMWLLSNSAFGLSLHCYQDTRLQSQVGTTACQTSDFKSQLKASLEHMGGTARERVSRAQT